MDTHLRGPRFSPSVAGIRTGRLLRRWCWTLVPRLGLRIHCCPWRLLFSRLRRFRCSLCSRLSPPWIRPPVLNKNLREAAVAALQLPKGKGIGRPALHFWVGSGSAVVVLAGGRVC
ncbi:hypothetical protein NDU88_003907 [Pleurodeles waltl]|uniref:Uncharacterized protein n=1 Tax=Pleurodeles waltl TaxID=8319 RepID=A0AAV7SHB1_PLEWA|nr:hypothetical protein NDU88_003907 [Pleurodeles waltl]